MHCSLSQALATSTTDRRIIATYLLALLVPCFAQALFMEIAFDLPIYAIVAYPLALGLGIPAYFLIRRRSWRSFPKVMFAGLFLGTVGARTG